MIRVASFFNDRRGIAAIDYAFIVVLGYALRSVAVDHGAIVGAIVKRALGVG